MNRILNISVYLIYLWLMVLVPKTNGRRSMGMNRILNISVYPIYLWCCGFCIKSNSAEMNKNELDFKHLCLSYLSLVDGFSTKNKWPEINGDE